MLPHRNSVFIGVIWLVVFCFALSLFLSGCGFDPKSDADLVEKMEVLPHPVLEVEVELMDCEVHCSNREVQYAHFFVKNNSTHSIVLDLESMNAPPDDFWDLITSSGYVPILSDLIDLRREGEIIHSDIIEKFPIVESHVLCKTDSGVFLEKDVVLLPGESFAFIKQLPRASSSFVQDEEAVLCYSKYFGSAMLLWYSNDTWHKGTSEGSLVEISYFSNERIGL